MEFKEFSCIYSLRKIWKELVDESSNNIYQSYEFNVLYYKYRITSISNIKKKNTKCRFIVAYENGEAKCIAPLAIDKQKLDIWIIFIENLIMQNYFIIILKKNILDINSIIFLLERTVRFLR